MDKPILSFDLKVYDADGCRSHSTVSLQKPISDLARRQLLEEIDDIFERLLALPPIPAE